ncbi:MAG TPA: ABC transporter substrate-binding protein [Burkholderiales bacterium]|nr:ABC transporter substrate-binding protein [Burkholderiales bacterium]
MRKLLVGVAMLGAFAVNAADKVKVGFISTLSGPNASIGIDIRDAFNLAVKLNGGKLGGLPAEVLVGDDGLKPEQAKQLAERYLQRDRVDFITGIVFSNVVLAVAPDAIASKVFFISPNAGPAQYTGAQCNPFFFAASWPSEAYSEAAGQYVTSKGLKSVIFLAPNYVGGHDAATGFKRYFKGKLQEEMYTKLGQLDYAAELSQIRAAKPQALYVFLPGGMGVNFIKQFVAAGLSQEIQLIVPLWGSDQDIIRAVGDPMLGLFSVGHWSIDLDNAANRKFVAEFEKEYKRLPTGYAASGYDTAMLMDSAIRKVKGKIEDKDALRAALRAADFKSVRGEFKFGPNQFPVQNYYLQLVGKDSNGRIVHKTIGTVLKDRADAYVQNCKMN